MVRRLKSKTEQRQAKKKKSPQSAPAKTKKKKYFYLLIEGTRTDKVYSMNAQSNRSAQDVAFRVAKKAWADNKLLNRIILEERGTMDIYEFESKAWMAHNDRKFRK